MTTKTIIELQAKAAQRARLVSIMDEVIATMRQVPGFQGISRGEVLDDPDRDVHFGPDGQAVQASYHRSVLAQTASLAGI